MEYPSDGLLEAIAELEERSRQEAELKVGYEVLDTLRTPGRRAAIIAETLKVMGTELDYAQTRKKAQLLLELETGELWAFHPSSPRDMKELLAEVRISKSEASDLIEALFERPSMCGEL